MRYQHALVPTLALLAAFPIRMCYFFVCTFYLQAVLLRGYSVLYMESCLWVPANQVHDSHSHSVVVSVSTGVRNGFIDRANKDLDHQLAQEEVGGSHARIHCSAQQHCESVP
jgi:hypothetical protein